MKLEWMAPEHIYVEKNSDWYWIVGIVTATVALISVIMNNTIFAILILVSGFTLSLFASRKPQTVHVSLENTGIRFGTMFYPYKNIESFYVETKDMYPRIIFKSKSYLSPIMKILIHIDDADEIEEILTENIQKEDLSEPLLEKILIRLGF